MEDTLGIILILYLFVASVHVFYRLWKLQSILLQNNLPAPKLPANLFILNYALLAIEKGKILQNKNGKELLHSGRWVFISYFLIILPLILLGIHIISEG